MQGVYYKSPLCRFRQNRKHYERISQDTAVKSSVVHRLEHGGKTTRKTVSKAQWTVKNVKTITPFDK